jgi:hypothetical protein
MYIVLPQHLLAIDTLYIYVYELSIANLSLSSRFWLISTFHFLRFCFSSVFPLFFPFRVQLVS